MAEIPAQDLPEGEPNRSGGKGPSTNSPNYPDPTLANLKCTESYYSRDDASITLPKLHVMNSYHFDIYGVDTIWHNMYLGPKSDWTTMRKQYDATIEQMVQMVGKHIADGLYGIISMNASKHSLTVVCGCLKKREELPSDFWDDPIDLRTFDWKEE